MPAHFDKLKPAQFANIRFPVSEVTFNSSHRHVVHEYPHTPGGMLEKLGRQVYHVRMTPVFDESIKTYDQANGFPLYPGALDRLQELFELEATAALTVPTVGTFDAFMSSFSRRMDVQVRSGERVEFEFVEDQTKVFRIEHFAVTGAANLEDLAGALRASLLGAVAAATPADKSLFEKILALADDVGEFANKGFTQIDRVERQMNRVAAKLDAISQLINRATSKLQMLQHPANWRLLESLKNLHASVEAMKNQVPGLSYGPKRYVVPRKMTIQQVSTALYKRSDRTLDILRMNDIEDSLAIPAGFEIRYLP